MFKLNSKNTRTTSMASSGVFIVNFEYFHNFTPFSSAFIVEFEQINFSWVVNHLLKAENKHTRTNPKGSSVGRKYGFTSVNYKGSIINNQLLFTKEH